MFVTAVVENTWTFKFAR